MGQAICARATARLEWALTRARRRTSLSRPMLLTALLLACAGPSGDDLSGALARLSAESARERGEAERWLAAHLRAEDFALAAEAARRGGLEERTRLARALGSDERHFELAVLFSAESDAELARVGADALTELAVRWFGEELTPWAPERVLREIAGRSRGLYSVQPFGAEPESVLDRLARHAPPFQTDRARDVQLGFAIDPTLYADFATGKVAPRGELGALLEGPFERVLVDTLGEYRVTFEGLGLEGQRPFLRIGYSSDLGRKPVSRLMVDWCRDVLQYPERPRGEGAARALAGCGWPAPLEWLEQRWRRARDRNALSGLLLAAGRGRVVPSLATAGAVERLLGEIAAQRAQSGAFDLHARRARVALARFPYLGSDGSDVARAVAAAPLEGPDGAAFKAAVLAGIGSAPEELRAALPARLGRSLREGDTLAARERVELLRLAARSSTGAQSSFEVALSSELLALVCRDRAQPQVLAWAESVGARPSPAWSAPERALALGDAELALLIEWYALTADGVRAAAGLVRAWCAAGRSELALGERLGERVRLGDRARVRRLMESARAGTGAASDAKLQRLEFLAGTADPAARSTWAAACAASNAVSAEDWPIVGALAGEPEGEPLLELLTSYAKGAAVAETRLDAPWVRAFERTTIALRARGDEVSCARLLRELRSALRSAPKHPLARALDAASWPALPGPRPLSLEALDGGS